MEMREGAAMAFTLSEPRKELVRHISGTSCNPLFKTLLSWVRVSGRMCNGAVMGCVVDVVRARIKHTKYAHMSTNPGPRLVAICAYLGDGFLLWMLLGGILCTYGH